VVVDLPGLDVLTARCCDHQLVQADAGRLHDPGDRAVQRQWGVFGSLFFFSSGRAGTVTVTDSCFGAVPSPSISFFFSTLFFSTQWTVPSLNGQPSATCAANVHVTSLEGGAIDVSANYSISP
jgi:hypothetical protein